MTNVIALPNYSAPSLEPVPRVVEILEEALQQAREGKITGVAVVSVERDPAAFVTEFHGEQSSRHCLSAGVLSLGYQIGKVISESD
jgi:hypothetical protein